MNSQMPELGNIPMAAREMLRHYDMIRGKSRDDDQFEFWDVVIITAMDAAQQTAYEMQLQRKLSRGELPRGVSYIVYADPPGPRTGCGGSTMYVLSELYALYGERLRELHVLLLHAGGLSQRLPSASVLGKLFTALPIGVPMYQLLDLKLASYLPLLARMPPGVFIASSDTIELYDLGDFTSPSQDGGGWLFNAVGFTALAHPSSLEIGTKHGVFVFEQTDTMNLKCLSESRKCLEVLQKPSIEQMTQKGAIVTGVEGTPIVYSDSCFFFCHSIGEKLRWFYSQNAPLNCEIDAYADFLQALGPRATCEYTNNCANVSRVEDCLVNVRRQLYQLLKGADLRVITLNASEFYHLGTLSEYLNHLSPTSQLAARIPLKRHVFNNIKDVSAASSACLIHNVFSDGNRVKIGSDSIVEFSRFTGDVIVGDNCVISNCSFGKTTMDDSVNIPAGTFMHTVPVLATGGATVYVTVVCSVSDDMKCIYKDGSDVRFFGRPLSERFTAVLPPGESSLWTARLFLPAVTMEMAVDNALNLIHGQNDNADVASERISLADLIRRKNITAMLAYHNDLYKDIVNCKVDR